MTNHSSFINPTVIAVLMAAACASAPAPSEQPSDARVRHIVLCWLKDPGNADHRARLIDTSKSLARIPGVLDITAGPVLKSDRKIVDSTFDVGIVFTLKSEADLKRYLTHPLHIRAMDKVLKTLVQRVVVYDFALR